MQDSCKADGRESKRLDVGSDLLDAVHRPRIGSRKSGFKGMQSLMGIRYNRRASFSSIIVRAAKNLKKRCRNRRGEISGEWGVVGGGSLSAGRDEIQLQDLEVYNGYLWES